MRPAEADETQRQTRSLSQCQCGRSSLASRVRTAAGSRCAGAKRWLWSERWPRGPSPPAEGDCKTSSSDAAGAWGLGALRSGCMASPFAVLLTPLVREAACLEWQGATVRVTQGAATGATHYAAARCRCCRRRHRCLRAALMEALQGVVAAAGPPLAAVVLGWALRRTPLFSIADGEVRAGLLCGSRASRLVPIAPLCTLTKRPTRPPAPHSHFQTAAKFAVWVTLPSLILQTFNGCAAGCPAVHRPAALQAALPRSGCRPCASSLLLLAPSRPSHPLCSTRRRLRPTDLPLPALAAALLAAALTAGLSWCARLPPLLPNLWHR